MGENLNSKGCEFYYAGNYLDAYKCFKSSLDFETEKGTIASNIAWVSYLLVKHGNTEYLSDAIKYAEIAEAKHNAVAAVILGVIYDSGDTSVPQEYKSNEKALYYYKRHFAYSGIAEAWNCKWMDAACTALNLVRREGKVEYLIDALAFATLSIGLKINYRTAYVLGSIYDPRLGKSDNIPKWIKSEDKAIYYYSLYLAHEQSDAKAITCINNMGILFGDFKHNELLGAKLCHLASIMDSSNPLYEKNYLLYKDGLSSLQESQVQSAISYDVIKEDIDNELAKINPELFLDKLSKEISSDVTSDNVASPNDRLQNLIGLNSIKSDVKSMVNFVQMQTERKRRGLKSVPVSLHLVFTGNPGTGKTTIARILADIYKDMGILSKGQLVEVDRADLVSGYVGQTAIQTRKKIDEALGGILFIDEAYTLAKEGNDFGQEAIDTILKAMEDHREDFIVIVAGYPSRMHQFINSNPGLKSRFNKYFEFPDYTTDEMIQIFLKLCEEYDYQLSADADAKMREYVITLSKNKGINFANGRTIRNLFEDVITHQASRIIEEKSEDIMTITAEDFE